MSPCISSVLFKSTITPQFVRSFILRFLVLIIAPVVQLVSLIRNDRSFVNSPPAININCRRSIEYIQRPPSRARNPLGDKTSKDPRYQILYIHGQWSPVDHRLPCAFVFTECRAHSIDTFKKLFRDFISPETLEISIKFIANSRCTR